MWRSLTKLPGATPLINVLYLVPRRSERMGSKWEVLTKVMSSGAGIRSQAPERGYWKGEERLMCGKGITESRIKAGLSEEARSKENGRTEE